MRAILGFIVIVLVIWLFVMASGIAVNTYKQIEKGKKKFDKQLNEEDEEKDERI